MKKIACSIHARFEGINPAKYWPCETYIQHCETESDTPNLSCDSQEIDPEDAEYNYDGIWTDRFDLVPRDPETREPVNDPEREAGYDSLHQVTVTGIASLGEVMRYLDHVGAFFEDCETMGTLGGPLSIGVVPDVSFRMESNLVIECIRVTPFIVDTVTKRICVGTKPSWDRVRALFKKEEPYRLAKAGSRDVAQDVITKAVQTGVRE